MGKYSREEAIKLIRDKYEEIQEGGENRYPKRSDFEAEEVMAIKAFLGPWPRALEAAGIKPPREDDHTEKAKEKRIRAKRNRTAYKKSQNSDKSEKG